MAIGNVLAELAVKIKVDSSELTKGLDKATQESENAMAKIGQAFKGLLPALSVAAVVYGIGNIISKTMELGEELENMSLRTGIGVVALQKLGNAAKMSGGSFDSLETAIKMMQTTIGQAVEGSKVAERSLENLGLVLEDLQQMAPDEQFLAIARAIESIPDPSVKVAAYRDIFGRAGTEVAVYVQNLEAAGKLPIMTEEQVAQAAAANEAFEKMKIAWGNLTNVFALTVLPNLVPLIDQLMVAIGWIGKLIDGISKLNDIMQQGILSIGGVKLPRIPGLGELLNFDSGGIVPGGIGQPQLAMVHGGEMVTPPGMASSGSSLVINMGHFMGDESALREFTRSVQRILDEETRRFSYTPSKTSYYSAGGHL